ncbi:TPA: hypothetical protein ACIX19_005720, partial [Escherichia coli]
SVYYNALFDVPNPENRLRIAMTAQVTLITDEAQNTLLVPIQAVHRNEGKKQQVLVLAADGRLEPRNVKTGITNSVDIQILEGLNGVVCGRGRNPTLRLWPTIFSGKIDVFPGDRRSRLISSMTSVAPA